MKLSNTNQQKAKFQAKFQAGYQMLNAEQKQAVDQTEGPIMILAGPGTGKTQVLALRIANILHQTDAKTNNILALTFTEAGTVAMRERLASFIGSDAYAININTFHGFCDQIIQSQPQLFAYRGKMTAIDDLTLYQLIINIINAGKYEQLRPLNNPELYVTDIIQLIGNLKREKISPAQFTNKINIEEQILLKQTDNFYKRKTVNKHTGQIFEVGDFKPGKELEIKLKINKLHEFNQVYQEYEDKIRKTGYYDYNDMILEVIATLENNADILASLQERYLYILVDEFQDSNSAQMRIIELLTQDNPDANIFVVGDDDQSIYRFQGASNKNIKDFLDRYQNIITINLICNYRSPQVILDLAESVMSNSKTRILSTKQLKAQKNNDINTTKPKLLTFIDQNDEDFWLLEHIKQMIADGIKPSEIVIIFSKNKEGLALHKLFNSSGLNANFSGTTNILDKTIITQLINILNYLDGHEQHRIFHLLHYDFFNIDPLSIWELPRLARTENLSLNDFLLKSDDKKYNQARTVITKFITWNKDKENKNLTELFGKIIQDIGLINYLIKHHNLINLEFVNTFYQEIKLQNHNNKKLTLNEFLTTITLRTRFNLGITRIIKANSDTAITLSTAHQMKGREADHIFLIHFLDHKFGQSKNTAKIHTFPLIDTEQGLDPIEEARRVSYVALTRSKKTLTITNSQTENMTSKTPSRFISEMDETKIIQENIISTNHQKQAQIVNNFNFTPTKFNHNKQSFIKNIVQQEYFRLSASSLNNYLLCPRQFLYQNVITIPYITNPSSTLGQCIHKALEEFYLLFKTTKKLPHKTTLISYLNDNLAQTTLLDTDLKYAQIKGHKILNNYYDFHHNDFKIPLTTELKLRNNNINKEGVRLSGIIDRIDDLGSGEVRIIDYKTSKAKSKNAILGLNKNPNLYNSNMGRQLKFYQLLTLSAPDFTPRATLFTLEFLEGNDKSTDPVSHDFTFSAAEITEFEELVQTTWHKIQNLEFPKTLDVENICEKCNNSGRCQFYDICWGEKNLKTSS